ncbi:hypothetical protein [Virgibacillus halodenitrificans]|uniref:Uncharacterized protein n=1 Tax=Virgibacillus halodenitrificans TaxID=1482 RepID=A0AAC9NK59_VIRHA|nr:hypothetical protein [Virgibacillus halodenitrificans]APC47723.1 hypothetical protein BME96_05865 [Virgibacillus halodenitrificans]MBD1222083.1 hypothetical protein [Virgibacillus halodenitrificans]MYL45712.1 hypothetical protein [Virgibacillus halodenitrificans]
MDLISVLNIIIVIVIVLAIVVTFLSVFASQFAKAQKKRADELMAMRKEHLDVQKEILSELKKLTNDSNSPG